ncbi:MAG: hypothetical protein WCJ97_09080 [Phycisphaerae bacterium]
MSEADESATSPDTNPENAPGTAKTQLEGWVPTLHSPAEIYEALEKAFDYRGDVTVTLKDGTHIEGYIFDRRAGSELAASVIRIMPTGSKDKVSVRYSDLAGLAFTGRDTAQGKSFETWVAKYHAKKAAGETNIGIDAEALD